MEKALYFEDIAIGQQFTNGGYLITKEHAIAFARDFDPQYFHTDEDAAKHSVFGKLAASGLYTAAVSMRLKIDSPLSKVSGGLIGLGLESVKWPHPVYPQDTLRIVITITGKRLSKSSPTKGVVTYRVDTYNQHDALVMEMDTAVLVPCLNSNKGEIQ